MLGFQTLSCLHDIPLVRSSTNKLHDVYAKAKDTSVLIRLPCNVAETVADKSLKVALTFATPFVKPFSGSVRVIDEYAAQKIRQIESKYPVINTPTEDVVNSVKDTTTSTLQHGKETVSNVATATVNKASGVADSLFQFCGTRTPGKQRSGSRGVVSSTVGPLLNYVFQSVQTSLVWLRLLAVFFLLKTKQVNDLVLTKLQQRSFVPVLPQRLLVVVGALLEYVVERIRLDDRTLADLKKAKQQYRYNPPTPQNVANRSSYKPDTSVKTRQNVVVTKQETVVSRTSGSNVVRQQPDYSNLTDKEELYARLANNDYTVDNEVYTTESNERVETGDIAQLHARINPTDVELLYAHLPSGTLPVVENEEPLTKDQQQLHARVIGTELEQQGYQDNDDDD